jgi:hypothetical protein
VTSSQGEASMNSLQNRHRVHGFFGFGFGFWFFFFLSFKCSLLLNGPCDSLAPWHGYYSKSSSRHVPSKAYAWMLPTMQQRPEAHGKLQVVLGACRWYKLSSIFQPRAYITSDKLEAHSRMQLLPWHTKWLPLVIGRLASQA